MGTTSSGSVTIGPITTPSVTPIQALADDDFTFGACRVIPYDHTNTKLFGPHFLRGLYDECLASRPSNPFGILPDVQCGMLDLTADAICPYWATKRLIVLTVADGNGFKIPTRLALADGSSVAGFAFITATLGAPLPPPGIAVNPLLGERSAFVAYAFFRPWWGTAETEVLAMLGAAYFFHTLKLCAMHGQSDPRNPLTMRFLSRLGCKIVATVPKFLARHRHGCIDGGVELVDCDVSLLPREDFEMYVARQLVSVAAPPLVANP